MPKTNTQFKKGKEWKGNDKGRPKGALNFSTKWMKFIEKVAEQNDTTPEAVDEQMLKVAYKQILSGDHSFWKDIMDRVYGQASQHIDIDERVETVGAQDVANKLQDILNENNGKTKEGDTGDSKDILQE